MASPGRLVGRPGGVTATRRQAALGICNNMYFFIFFLFFEEQRAPRERAPSSELRLEGKGVKRTRETVVPFCEVENNFRQGSEKMVGSVEITCFFPFVIRMFPNRAGD